MVHRIAEAFHQFSLATGNGFEPRRIQVGDGDLSRLSWLALKGYPAVLTVRELMARHRANPVMPVSQRRRFLELRHRIRPPLRHLAQPRLIRPRLLDYLPFDTPLRDQQRRRGLLLSRFFRGDPAGVAVP